jgi:hypothetical protein
MSEKLHAVAQQNNRPFVQVAAWIKRRTYRSQDFADLGIRKFCRRSIALHMQHSSCCNAAQVRKAVIEDSDNR